MMKRENILKILLSVILLTPGIYARISAQALTIELSAPEVVSASEQFKLVYSFNENAQLKQPDFGEFVYLGGPSRGQSSYTSIVNGKMTSENSYTFTYYLQAPDKAGEYTIPAASATFKNKTYKADSHKIEVVQGGGSRHSGSTTNRRQNTNSSDGDLFLAMELDKKIIYKGEAVTARLKLYSDPQMQLSDLEYKTTPEFPGFYREDIEQEEGIQNERVRIGDKVYTVYTLQEVVLYPQKLGDIYIDPVRVQVLSLVRVQDPFWGSSYQRKPVVRTSKPVKVSVKALPETSSINTSGGVGIFNIRSKVQPQEIIMNDAISYEVIITGSGNIKFIDEIEGNFPGSFEIIGPHRELSLNKNRKSGKLSFEYTAIAREAGTFHIEPFSFTYFDVEENKYKTLKTESYDITVKEGDNPDEIVTAYSLQNAASARKLEEDISYIEMETGLKSIDRFIFGRIWFYQIYLGALLIFLAVLIFRREQLRRSANAVRYKNRRAGRVVSKRLRKAQSLLKANDIAAYYDELERALWGYLADKMNIQISDLSIDNVNTEMVNRNVDKALADEFTEVIQNCQFARYAPGGMEAKMEGLFEKARVAINKLDQKI